MLNPSDRSRREEFLSEEDLDLVNLTPEELITYWNQWLIQAQMTNDSDADEYSHGVFMSPSQAARLLEEYSKPQDEHG